MGYENVYLLPERLEIQQTPKLKKTADVVLDVILCPFVLGQSPSCLQIKYQEKHTVLKLRIAPFINIIENCTFFENRMVSGESYAF